MTSIPPSSAMPWNSGCSGGSHSARHRVLDVVVGRVQPAQRDGDRQHLEPDRQHGDRDEPGNESSQCWQRRQNTVVRPAMRTADSGRPHV